MPEWDIEELRIDPYCEVCEEVTEIRVWACRFGRCLGNPGCGALRAECVVCGHRIASNCEHGW